MCISFLASFYSLLLQTPFLKPERRTRPISSPVPASFFSFDKPPLPASQSSHKCCKTGSPADLPRLSASGASSFHHMASTTSPQRHACTPHRLYSPAVHSKARRVKASLRCSRSLYQQSNHQLCNLVEDSRLHHLQMLVAPRGWRWGYTTRY